MHFPDKLSHRIIQVLCDEFGYFVSKYADEYINQVSYFPRGGDRYKSRTVRWSLSGAPDSKRCQWQILQHSDKCILACNAFWLPLKEKASFYSFKEWKIAFVMMSVEQLTCVVFSTKFGFFCLFLWGRCYKYKNFSSILIRFLSAYTFCWNYTSYFFDFLSFLNFLSLIIKVPWKNYPGFNLVSL